ARPRWRPISPRRRRTPRRCSITSTPRCRPRCRRSAPRRCVSHPCKEASMAELNLVEAVNCALAREMARDVSVLLLGQDIGVNGGVFRATVGLQQRFGAERVLDTTLAETAIVGTAIGMASMGLRPVAEIQFSGFIYPAFDHLVNHASRLRHRTRGRLSCPLVLRSPSGG